MVLTRIFVFVFGLAIGSFLNVLIYRLPRDLTLAGRSFCPRCKKQIAWYDNVPVLSFLALGGKCRHCRSPISLQYPLVELTTALLFMLVFFLSQGSLWLIAYGLWLVSALLVIFAVDLKHQIIPDLIVYPTILVALFFHLLNQQDNNLTISNYLFSAFAASLFFLLLHLLTRGRGMGLGDVKFSFLMGLVLGFPKIIVAFYLAFLTGAIFGVILVLTGRKKFGEHLPFGPFLAGGTILAFFAGEQIFQWLTARLL